MPCEQLRVELLQLRGMRRVRQVLCKEQALVGPLCCPETFWHQNRRVLLPDLMPRIWYLSTLLGKWVQKVSQETSSCLGRCLNHSKLMDALRSTL